MIISEFLDSGIQYVELICFDDKTIRKYPDEVIVPCETECRADVYCDELANNRVVSVTEYSTCCRARLSK